MSKSKISLLFQYLVILIFVIGGSYVVSTTWVQKAEVLPDLKALTINKTMTLSEFASVNNLNQRVVSKVFDLESKEEFNKTVKSFGIGKQELTIKVDKVLAIEAEHGSKNWKKILAKFLLWFAFLGAVFFLVKSSKTSPNQRKLLYLISTVIFGVVLGADPSAMGTVKDALVLFAEKGVIFPPRMIALTVFLIMVVAANKLFCGWGCQLGALQDLVFRTNRDKKDRKGIIRQFKLPFAFTNGFRILFFIAFIIIAFSWSFDLVGYIDPFKVFKPEKIYAAGWGFLAVILLSALFVYRPWCTFFCPFGLVGWFFEKLSFYKIKVDYSMCASCQSCAKACPNSTMEAILKREKTIGDCYSCSSCIDACPSGAISLSKGKRPLPPEGKFTTLK